MCDSCIKEWNNHEEEYLKLEIDHRIYCEKVEDAKLLQNKCLSTISRQRNVLKVLQEDISKLKRTASIDELELLIQIENKIFQRKEQYRNLEDVLPHENGLYLKIVIGSVNVSLLSKYDKYKYKQDYELFKLYVTIVNLLFGLTLMFFLNYRVTDAMYQFILVWYYCTLTIREHILIVNGSRIKGWWITHHFISTACAGLLLIWPESYSYNVFRPQFVLFSVYLGLIQLMQYYYQSGLLYRLRALGEKRSMDLTVEGFQSWMWRGLTFLFPLLIIGYLFQLYNAYVLFVLSFNPKCNEWQVFVLSLIFFFLFIGNTSTATGVLRQKIKEKIKQSNAETFPKKQY